MNESIRKLHNGFYVIDEDGTGKFKLARCSWLVEVPSGHPEPDSYADTVKIVDCNARITWFSESGASFECEHGHRYVGYTEGGAADEYEREQRERYEEWYA